jgi:tetratricopeptide (TPR) repeat protein
MPPTSGPLPEDPQPFPTSIGRYRILRLLGEGGMGMVYEAEQDFPQRIVALKVIRAGYATGEMLRRFENETQALGRLQHPGIAQIYDAGAVETPFGKQPYIAMELVRGQTLLDYCDSQKLNTRERLELMAKICDAVQHAHQRGLIHRDLKPANILVGEDGQPKILDLGVARLTDSDAQATRQTNMGEIIGTLAYMSPEQVSGEAADIDTRSDVYALGVILYEVLSGKAPYTIGRQIHEAVRAIRQDEPTALSSVNRTYRGDIETIVARALEKDKTRRYESAAELAADIRRYLHDEPIVARPPSTTYQLQKFARRHKAVVSGIAAVFVVLALGVAASTWEAVQAQRAQKKAQQQAAIAEAVNDFLQKDLLGQASAYNQATLDPNLTVRTALDRAAQNIHGKFAGQPEVEAAIRQTIGRTYGDLGLYQQEQHQLEQAFDLSRRTLGIDDPRTLSILARLGEAEKDLGNYGQAEALEQRAFDHGRRALGPDNPVTLQAMTELALDYSFERKFAQADPLSQQALMISRKTLGPESRNTLLLMNAIAWDERSEGKYGQAEALYREVVERKRRVLGPEHPETLGSMGELAYLYDVEKKYAQAEALSRQVVDVQRRVLGPEHPDTLQSMLNLATVYWDEGEFARVETLNRQILTGMRRVLGPIHPYTLAAVDNLAAVFLKEGKYRQSEAVYQEALKTAPDNPELLNAYAWFLLTVKNNNFRRPKEALQFARRAIKASANPRFLNTLGLAEVRNALWNDAIATLDKSAGADHGSNPTDFLFLAMAYHGRGDRADADNNYDRAARIIQEVPTTDPDVVMLWAEAAAVLSKPRPKLPQTGKVEAR